MTLRLFRIDMVGAFTPSASAIIDAATPEPKEFIINMESSVDLVLQRKSYVSINFAEIGLDLGKTYTVTLPPGFFLDGFDEPSAGNSFNFTTPATVPLVSEFTPAPTAANHNTYADQYVYIDYGRLVLLQNKNFYLYSDYGNPSGYKVSTINALSNRVSKVSDSKVRIDLSPDLNPSRSYWIRADEGAVVDSFYFKSAEITGNTYNFTTVSASSAAISTTSSLSCTAMKVKVVSAPLQSTSTVSIKPTKSLHLMYSIAGSFSQVQTYGNYTLTVGSGLQLYNNTTGTLVRTTSVESNGGSIIEKISIALNSNHYAIGVAYYDVPENSFVKIYSISTGALVNTITGDISGLGRAIAMNDSRMAITGACEYNGIQAGVLLYSMTPSGLGGLIKKITRPNTPWRQGLAGKGYWTNFGNKVLLNNNYLVITEPNDAISSTSNSTGNFKIYDYSGNIAGSNNSGITGADYEAFWDLQINNSVLVGSYNPQGGSNEGTVMYNFPSGSFNKLLANNPGKGARAMNDEFLLISDYGQSSAKFYELSSGTYPSTFPTISGSSMNSSNTYTATIDANGLKIYR